MTTTPSSNPSDPIDAAQVQDLLLQLRRKSGNWVQWGQACQTLQKAGYSPQKIFEETGFEPIQQNQITVAAQVYGSLVNGDAPSAVLSRYETTGSDSLYEFRILNHQDRIAAATVAVEKGLDSEGAKDVAKALKEFSLFAQKPDEFAAYPDDAIAYFFWKVARQQGDLQARSRLIAQGLRFAKSDSARKAIEQLLTDFTVTKSRPAPFFPFYRLESAEQQPRIVPVAGQLPLALEDLQAVPMIIPEGQFDIVKFSATGAWMALPGWQVVYGAEDPVMVLTNTDQLPIPPQDEDEDVMLMVDRAQRTWDENAYVLVNDAGTLKVNWFETAPELPIVGRVVLALRPKKVLDEAYNKDLWQLDE
jgi:hypothetical protein